MKRCPECGGCNDDSSSFCPRCGCVLPDTSDVPSPQPHTVMVHTAYSAPRSHVSPGTVIGALAIVAIIIAAAFSVINLNGGIGGGSDGYKDATRTVEWSVPSIGTTEFSVTFSIEGSEMDAAAASSIDRRGSSTNISDHSAGIYAVSEYVVVGNAVKALSQTLWDTFDRDAPASCRDAKHFCDYVLAFVQAAAHYEFDSDKFGQDEYWQYPVETLYRGYGDCEDTSIMASAIYSQLSSVDGARDYVSGACLFLLPCHAMVGVNVNGGITPASSEVYFSVDDATTHCKYYFGETTVSDPGSHRYYNPAKGEGSWYYLGAVSNNYLGADVTLFTGTASVYV